MNVLGLIPARGGSKRFRNKNTVVLEGLPLWQHALAQARSSCVLDAVALSTDIDEIIDYVYAHCGKDVVAIRRPKHLCADTTEMLPVVMHALDAVGGSALFDAVCILQPTSPFRTGNDIANCLKLMHDTGAEAVVSVTEGPDDLCFQVRHANRIERLPKVVIPNGAIYMVRTSTLERGGSWYNDHTYGYVMKPERGLDINVSWDFEVAKLYAPNMRVSE